MSQSRLCGLCLSGLVKKGVGSVPVSHTEGGGALCLSVKLKDVLWLGTSTKRSMAYVSDSFREKVGASGSVSQIRRGVAFVIISQIKEGVSSVSISHIEGGVAMS